jgi:hypothetical protein
LQFLEFFLDYFGAITVKMACFLIQMVKFIFKQSKLNSNEPITCCHIATAPTTLAVATSAGSNDWAVAPRAAPTQVLPPAPARLNLCHPILPPRRPVRALPPEVPAVAPLGWALPPPVGTTLTWAEEASFHKNNT